VAVAVGLECSIREIRAAKAGVTEKTVAPVAVALLLVQAAVAAALGQKAMTLLVAGAPMAATDLPAGTALNVAAVEAALTQANLGQAQMVLDMV
jgi:hypothetical protein